jgi:site-specific DNA-cytosine methylase
MPKHTCTHCPTIFTSKKALNAHLKEIVDADVLAKKTTAVESAGGRLAISLFSGAGGDTVGMEQAGLRVVAFSENNAACVRTHKAAFPDSVWLGESVKGDISKIPDSEFEPYANKVAVVFAGFPCQGFSNAGKKNVNDPRNRMFQQFLRVVRIVQPEWIFGENVAGLLTKKTDDGENSVIDAIKECFAEAMSLPEFPELAKFADALCTQFRPLDNALTLITCELSAREPQTGLYS